MRITTNTVNVRLAVSVRIYEKLLFAATYNQAINSVDSFEDFSFVRNLKQRLIDDPAYIFYCQML